MEKNNLKQLLARLKKPEEYLLQLVDILKENERGLLPLFHSSTTVSIPIATYGPLKNVLIFKSGKDENKLRREMRIQNSLRKILAEDFSDKRYFVPRPLTVLPYNDSFFYVMQMIKGEDLSGRIERQHPKLENNLEKIVDFLALIHTHVNLSDFGFPTQIDYKERERVREKRIREAFEKFDLDRGKADQIIDNLNPIMEEIYIHNSYIVFYKDAHLLNWLITPNNAINAIDFDGGVAIPEYDLVVLLASMPASTVTNEGKEEFVKKYGEYFSFYKGSGFRKPEESIRLYLNLSLERAATVARTFSGEEPESKKWNDAIICYLLNATGTPDNPGIIKRIEEKYPSYYSKFSKQYKWLMEGLQYLKTSILEKKT